jgi:hypothetical protein
MVSDAARNLSVIVSALVAAAGFWRNQRTQTLESRQREVEAWIKTIIHSYLQRSNDTNVNFDTIVSQARTDSVAFRKHQINADELSPEAVRRALISMVADRIISQAGNDRYSLDTPENSTAQMKKTMDEQSAAMQEFFSSMNSERKPNDDISKQLGNAMTSMANTFIIEKSIRDEILRQVTDDPFRYTRADLILRVVQATGANNDIVKAKTAEMVVSKELARNSNGMIGPANLDGPDMIDIGPTILKNSGV